MTEKETGNAQHGAYVDVLPRCCPQGFSLKKCPGDEVGVWHVGWWNLITSVRLIQVGNNRRAPGDFAQKLVLKLDEWFSGHCRAIKS